MRERSASMRSRHSIATEAGGRDQRGDQNFQGDCAISQPHGTAEARRAEAVERCEAARAAIRFGGLVREDVLKCTIAPGFGPKETPSSTPGAISLSLPHSPCHPQGKRGGRPACGPR